MEYVVTQSKLRISSQKDYKNYKQNNGNMCLFLLLVGKKLLLVTKILC